MLDAEAVAKGIQHDLDDKGIAKTAREEKLRARKAQPENEKMAELYRQVVLKEPKPELATGPADSGPRLRTRLISGDTMPNRGDHAIDRVSNRRGNHEQYAKQRPGPRQPRRDAERGGRSEEHLAVLDEDDAARRRAGHPREIAKQGPQPPGSEKTTRRIADSPLDRASP